MTTHAHLTPRQINTDCICLNTQRAARAVARRYDAAFRPINLSSGQFSILAALNQDESVSMGALAEILGLERTTLTRNLRPLMEAGLIGSESGDDKRVRAIALTKAGRDKLAMAMPLWATAQLGSHAALGTSAWPDIQAALAKLSKD